MVAKARRHDKVLAAAGGFTGLWALTWLGSTMMGTGAVTQGAFGLGTVVAGGELTALWWKTRAVGRYDEANGEAESHKT